MFVFPSEVPGWLTEDEGRALHGLAAGKRVLEIGSYCGRSTVCLAQAAVSVDAIDPHDGRDTPDPQPTLRRFQEAIAAHGLGGRVTAHVGTSATICPTLFRDERLFDLVFIDGAHDLASVRTDAEWAVRLLAADGLIAFHDYRSLDGQSDGKDEPGVTQTVQELIGCGAVVSWQLGSLLVMRPPKQYVPPRAAKKVLLGMPMRPGEQILAGAALGFFGPTCFDRSVSVSRFAPASSVLPWTFDTIWIAALNGLEKGDYTHFAMLHDDVCPEANWLGVLLNELDAHEADIVSAVVPLKDQRGLTSTAVDDTGDKWNPRRFTMTEVFDQPETFTHPRILLNTGCWVADLRKPWVTAERGGVLACSFHQRNRIFRNRNGLWEPAMRSEDWEFSRLVRAAGGRRQFATRKAKLYHQFPTFTNAQPWGECQRDPCHPLPEPAGVA